jgi:hypothetical protein
VSDASYGGLGWGQLHAVMEWRQCSAWLSEHGLLHLLLYMQLTGSMHEFMDWADW